MIRGAESFQETDLASGNMPTTSLILGLPDDILIRILSYLSPREVVNFSLVCKRFRAPANDDLLVWAPICRSILGTSAASSPLAWRLPTFRCLYTKLLYTYGHLLGAPWQGILHPFGSLLVAYPAPPYIIGGVISNLRLADAGVTVVPVFRVEFHGERNSAVCTCLRSHNNFNSAVQRALQGQTGAGRNAAEVDEELAATHPPHAHQPVEDFWFTNGVTVHDATLTLSWEQCDGMEAEEGSEVAAVGTVAAVASTAAGEGGAVLAAAPAAADVMSDAAGGDAEGIESEEAGETVEDCRLISMASGSAGEDGGQGSKELATTAAPEGSECDLRADIAASGEAAAEMNGGGADDGVSSVKEDVDTACGGVKDDVMATRGVITGGGSSGGNTGGGGGRRRTYGRRLKEFTFSCSGNCRHLEVEAVCRWAPAGLAHVPKHMLEPQTPAEVEGATGASGGGGDEAEAVVELDVLTAYGSQERVHRVAWALHSLMLYEITRPVSYRRIHPSWSPRRPQPATTPSTTTLSPSAPSIRPTTSGPSPSSLSEDPHPPAESTAAAATGATTAETPSSPLSSSLPPSTTGAASFSATSTSVEVAEPAAVMTAEGEAGPAAGPLVGRVTTVPTAPGAVMVGPHQLEGLWRGTYSAHGMELILVRRVGPQVLEGRKVTGDDNVPAGAASFRIYLDRPGTWANRVGSPFHLPPDYTSRVDLTPPQPAGPLAGSGGVGGGSSRARRRGGGGSVGRPAIVRASYGAEGQVAGSGFEEPQWIGAEALVLGPDTCGLLWYDLQSFSAFQRLRLLPEWGPGP